MVAEPKVVVILGPTASGKSGLALELAIVMDGEIIAADSRTIYKEASIGTAKPTAGEMSGVLHHMIDVIDPDQQFSAAEFKRQAQKLIRDIQARGNLPVVVGGSGLYLDSLLYDYQFPAGPNNKLRQELELLPMDILTQRLKLVDAAAYNSVDIKNRRRVIRAIETVGQPRQKAPEIPGNYLVMGLNPPSLNERIERRAHEMVSRGLKDEISSLADRYGWDSPVMSASGYGQLRSYLNLDDEALGQKLATIHSQLARKQMTWFKRSPHIKWFDDHGKALAAAKEFVSTKSTL